VPNLPLNPLPLGQLTVATPGTPIGFTSNCQTFYGQPFYLTDPTGKLNGPNDLWAERIYIRANPNNAGNVYIGYAGMNKSTGQGVVAVLSKSDPPFALNMAYGANKLWVGQFEVDADNASDSIFASAQLWG